MAPKGEIGMTFGRSPQSVTDDLKAIVENLEAQNQGQARVRISVLLSDLGELTTLRRHPTTRRSIYPAEQAGFNVEKTLVLKKALAHVASDVEAGHLDRALTTSRHELDRWTAR